MYTPSVFKNNDFDAIRLFIEKNSFGLLINTIDQKPFATHIPFLFHQKENNKNYLFGHLSKANPQWHSFNNKEQVLVVFSGPHQYVSSSWYDHESAPTWNYIAVHVYGRILLQSETQLRASLALLMNKHEQGKEAPNKLSEKYVAHHIQGIVGFEIEITEIQATEKLSQDKNEKNQQAIIKGLETANVKDQGLIAAMKKMK